MEAQAVRVAQKIRKLYTWENFARQTLELWEKVAAPAPAPVGDRRKRRKILTPGPSPTNGEGSKLEKGV